jgi:diguanylate cyclase (GGDEF)-like protein/PAS domain S-box-containing protein
MDVVPQSDEAERLRSLYEYDIIDTSPDKLYDDVVALAALICGTPMSAVSLLDTDRQWFKARHGIDFCQTERSVSFCQHALFHPDEVLVVPDAHEDSRFAGSPLVTSAPHIRFYAGVPLVTSKRHVLGTLCVLDRTPRVLTAEQTGALRALAVQVVAHIEGRLTTRLLHNRERHFEAFFERSMVGMATILPDGRWGEVNGALCNMLGYTHDEVMRVSWERLSCAEDFPVDRYRFDQAMHSGLTDYEMDKRLIGKDGRIVHVHIAARCIRAANGTPDYFVLLLQDVTQHRQSEERIWYQANFDALTGLPNRHMFLNRLEQECAKARRAGSLLGLLFIDLDRFKEVNDTLGHTNGDTVLIDAAKRITSCVRQTDTVARLGADEFIVLVGPLETTCQLERIAQSVLDRLAEPFPLESAPVYLSASIGLTIDSGTSRDAEKLVCQAEQAMVLSKQRGRNSYSHFTKTLQESAIHRLRTINDLHGALAGGQFRLHFQPIVDLWNHRIVKAEILLRWMHPVRGLVSPAEFIPIAEESGLIVDIGAWVLEEAAKWSVRLKRNNKKGLQVSVNMSPVQFKTKPEQFDALIASLEQQAKQGANLVIEITEGLLLNAEPLILDRLNRIRQAGIEVAIDDFGTGYSSLAYLKKFDIDYLKIDQSFIRDLETDPGDMALSETIIVVAHKLGLKVIAEGVETPGQLLMLDNAGCDYAQGYLFSKPVPSDDFIHLLQQEESFFSTT